MANSKGSFLGWGQVFATLFLGIVGLVFTAVLGLQQEENRRFQFQMEENNRKSQLAVQLRSQREQSEMNFRQNMFEVLVDKYLSKVVLNVYDYSGLLSNTLKKV